MNLFRKSNHITLCYQTFSSSQHRKIMCQTLLVAYERNIDDYDQKLLYMLMFKNLRSETNLSVTYSVSRLITKDEFALSGEEGVDDWDEFLPITFSTKVAAFLDISV